METYKSVKGSYYEDLHLAGHKSQSWFYESREAYLLAFSRLKKGDRVLDVGCGSGMVTRKIAEKVGCRVIGLDVSQSCIQHANQHSPSLGEASGYVLGSVEELPFQKGSFDVIIFSHVIEHIHSPTDVLHTLSRALKKGGSLIITTPNYRSLWPLAEKVFDKKLAEKGYSLHDQHISPLNSVRLTQLMKQSGLSNVVVETHYIVALPISLLSTQLAQFVFSIEKLFSFLPFGTIVYARGVQHE